MNIVEELPISAKKELFDYAEFLISELLILKKQSFRDFVNKPKIC